ncbi:uncharacterized protein [Miscanthus floridulus]|uniref:uncharacterized protein n=1 Tax=Miscanthus floridulus TaxID=154761 RepID=UPI003458C598
MGENTFAAGVMARLEAGYQYHHQQLPPPPSHSVAPKALFHRCLALAIARRRRRRRPALALARCWDPVAPPSSPTPPADASGPAESSPTANILTSLHIGLVLILLHAVLHKAEDNADAEVARWIRWCHKSRHTRCPHIPPLDLILRGWEPLLFRFYRCCRALLRICPSRRTLTPFLCPTRRRKSPRGRSSSPEKKLPRPSSPSEKKPPLAYLLHGCSSACGTAPHPSPVAGEEAPRPLLPNARGTARLPARRPRGCSSTRGRPCGCLLAASSSVSGVALHPSPVAGEEGPMLLLPDARGTSLSSPGVPSLLSLLDFFWPSLVGKIFLATVMTLFVMELLTGEEIPDVVSLLEYNEIVRKMFGNEE